MNKRLLIEILGWYGVLAILGAYILLTFGFMVPTSVGYQLLNITGSLGLMVEALKKRDWQSMALNLIWMLVAVLGLVSFFSKR